MRSSLSILIISVLSLWLDAPIARAQTAGSQPATPQQTAVQPAEARPAAAPIRGAAAAHPSRHSPSRQARSRRATSPATARQGAAGGKADGVLALGATDITGNKELPKVMVIVPWKDSLGASGVVKPTDSLMDEVLAPVDRAVFQRQVRYYGQLNGAGQRAPAGQVAPVGDSR